MRASVVLLDALSVFIVITLSFVMGKKCCLSHSPAICMLASDIEPYICLSFSLSLPLWRCVADCLAHQPYSSQKSTSHTWPTRGFQG